MKGFISRKDKIWIWNCEFLNIDKETKRQRRKMYKVIFNQDEKNYEEVETLEKAKEFAKRYANTEIIYYSDFSKVSECKQERI